MECHINCQSGAWGVFTQYSLVVTAISLIPSGKNSITIKNLPCLLIHLHIGMIQSMRSIVLKWKQQKTVNNKMSNKICMFLSVSRT